MILNKIKLRIEYCGNESSDIMSSLTETRFSRPLPVAPLDITEKIKINYYKIDIIKILLRTDQRYFKDLL